MAAVLASQMRTISFTVAWGTGSLALPLAVGPIRTQDSPAKAGEARGEVGCTCGGWPSEAGVSAPDSDPLIASRASGSADSPGVRTLGRSVILAYVHDSKRGRRSCRASLALPWQVQERLATWYSTLQRMRRWRPSPPCQWLTRAQAPQAVLPSTRTSALPM